MEIPLNGCSSPNLNKEGYLDLAKSHPEPCIIPLFIRIPVPPFSPVELYRGLTREHSGKQRGPGGGFLLESMDGDSKTAAYSFFGINPVLRATCYPADMEVSGDAVFLEDVRVPAGRDAIETIETLINVFSAVPSRVPRFSGGLVGYFSYDLVYSLLPESARIRHKYDITSPVAEFMLCLDCMVLDHHRSDLWIIRNVVTGNGRDPDELYDKGLEVLMMRYRAVRKFLEENPSRRGEQPDTDIAVVTERPQYGRKDIARVKEPDDGNSAPGCKDAATGPDEEETEKQTFTSSVRQVRDLIHSGEIVQAVISRKEEYSFRENPLLLYQALRSINPSPYMYYLDFSDYSIVGASPEMLVRVEGRNVTTVPDRRDKKTGNR